MTANGSFHLSLMAGLMMILGSSREARADRHCQRDFIQEVRACKKAFLRCVCPVCPRAKRCGGKESLKSCTGAKVTACVATRKACFDRARPPREACFRKHVAPGWERAHEELLESRKARKAPKSGRLLDPTKPALPFFILAAPPPGPPTPIFSAVSIALAASSSCSGVVVPDQSGFNKRIALTFDDGPNPETTAQVIAILKRQNTPATFFINGKWIDSQADRTIIKQVADDPMFLLANHTYAHINLAQQTRSKVASEVDSVATTITGTGEPQKFMRFPFGSSTCTTMQLVRDRRLVATGWHIDSADWCFSSGGGKCKKETFKWVPDRYRSDMKAYVLSQAREEGGGILLFHDIHDNTADNLEAIILALKAEGFSFVRLDDAATFPKLNGVAPPPPPPAKFVGDRCTAAVDCAFTSSGAAGFCHARGFCSLTCNGTCPDLAGKAPTFCIADPGVAPARGVCVSKAAPQNHNCADLAGTTKGTLPRFGNAAKTADVCAPKR
ncbi:MAG: polysaccharide deacetylase family protein [Deltaproteobacteria bacterium]|nr:polysaccharide deacetylase family protein [Deltaproteobacteria bacterium]